MLKFTIYHGLAVSVVLHSLLGLPFVVYDLAASTDNSEVLVVDLQGVASDTQTEQKVLGTVKGSEKQQEVEQSKPAETPPPPPPQPEAQPSDDKPTEVVESAEQPAPEPVQPTPPAPTSPPPVPQQSPETQAGTQNDRKGVDEKQDAETIKANQDFDTDRLRDFAKALSKQVQAHLIYPDEGRSAGLHGTTTVSFTVLHDGRIRRRA